MAFGNREQIALAEQGFFGWRHDPIIAIQAARIYQGISKQGGEPMMNVDLGWACVSLLPTAPYSVIEASRLCVLGLALERQRGVHTVGSDRRQDFDAWPGDLAVTASNVNMFSESHHGGEYLTVHLQCTSSVNSD